MKLLMENWRRYLKEEVEGEASLSFEEIWNNTSDEHLKTSFGQRSPGGAGSTFEDGTTLESLKNATDWRPIKHKNIGGSASGWRTDKVGGVLGMLPSDDFPDDKEVTFQAAHMGKAQKDGKTIYEVVTTFDGGRPSRSWTTLLVGPKWPHVPGHAKDPNKPVVWTFFPGDATPPPGNLIFAEHIEELGRKPGKDKFGKPSYVGNIGDAKKLGYKNIKHSEPVAEEE